MGKLETVNEQLVEINKRQSETEETLIEIIKWKSEFETKLTEIIKWKNETQEKWTRIIKEITMTKDCGATEDTLQFFRMYGLQYMYDKYLRRLAIGFWLLEYIVVTPENAKRDWKKLIAPIK